MKSHFWLLSCLLFLFSGGCFNLEVKEPLVDVGAGDAPAARDPAPGVADDRLSREQLLERHLARCQHRLQSRKDKIERIEDNREHDKKQYERKLDELEDKLKAARKENRRLSKDIDKLLDD